jgi:hypothetical protein
MDRVAPLLAQFPGPLRLAASRWKWLPLLVAGVVFTASGINWIREPNGEHVVLGWFGAIFFGICTATIIICLSPRAFQVVLDKNGFTTSVAYRRQRWEWADVGDFAVVTDRMMPAVVGASRKLRMRPGFNDRRTNKSKLTAVGEQLSEIMTGRDFTLPDSYGLPVMDFVRLMTLWQQRALEQQPKSGPA